MDMDKNIVKITESKLKQIISESITKILNESMIDWFDDDVETMDIEEIKDRLAFFDKYPHALKNSSYNMLYITYKTALWTRAHIMWTKKPTIY